MAHFRTDSIYTVMDLFAPLPTATGSDASKLKRKQLRCSQLSSLGVTDAALLHLQVQLYEDFAKSRAKASVDESISSASAEEEEEEEERPKLKATGHVFQVGSRTVPFLRTQSEDGGFAAAALKSSVMS